MARGVNKAILVGNMGNDPELRQLPSGAAVVNFNLATTEQWKDKQSGNKQERTEWHRVAAFGRLAEVIGEYTKKGTQLYVEGKIQTKKYTDNNGVDRFPTQIVARDVQILGNGASGGNASSRQPQSGQPRHTGGGDSQPPAREGAAPAEPATAGGESGGDFDDEFQDDIPF